MGNGFTFPLQTMIFASLVTAAYKVCGIRIHKPYRQNLGNFAVFGDDIIVDSRVYNLVVRCLAILGFKVNGDKSFNEGLFRESCGSDFYSGYNVRGVYVQTLLDDSDSYSAINRLNRWSATHGIFLTRTVSYLRRGCRFLGVPYDEADDSGIKTPVSLLRTVRRDRNGAIKYLARLRSPLTIRFPSVDRDSVFVDHNQLTRLRALLPQWRYDSDLLLFCLLAGWLRDGSVTLRVKRNRTVLRRRVCPGWDERVAACGVNRISCEKWKFFTAANLVS
jgi:hypothetical protein